MLEGVAEQFDALGQLAWVGGFGGEGVGEVEDGGIFAGGVELVGDLGEDGDVLEGRWEAISSAYVPLAWSGSLVSWAVNLPWTHRDSKR